MRIAAVLLAASLVGCAPDIRIWTGSPDAARERAGEAAGDMEAMAADGAAEIVPAVPVRIRASHYWPPLGGPNCARFVRGRCISAMASGERWEEWAYRRWDEPGAAACPPQWPFGTVVRAFGRDWICLDRGSRIVFGRDGIPWVDFLYPRPLAPHGSVVDAIIIFPRGGEE